MDLTFETTLENANGDRGVTAAIVAGQRLELARGEVATTVHRVGDNGTPFRLDNGVGKLESIEHLLPAPIAIQQQVHVLTAAAFREYVNRFKVASTVVFFDREATFTALLDYHAPGAPSWVKHRVDYTVRSTREWLLWTGNHNKPMTQDVFAQFLEDNLPDILRPDGASIVEAARRMEATKDVTFKSVIRVADGSSQFTYDEVVNNGTRTDQVNLLSGLTLSLSVFEGLPPQDVQARIRYVIGNNGKLAMRYMLVRPEDAKQEALDLIAGQLTEGIPGVLFLDGHAPASIHD